MEYLYYLEDKGLGQERDRKKNKSGNRQTHFNGLLHDQVDHDRKATKGDAWLFTSDSCIVLHSTTETIKYLIWLAGTDFENRSYV